MKILITDINLRKTFDVSNILKRYVNSKDLIYTYDKKLNIFSFLVYDKSNFLLRKDSFIHFEEDFSKILEVYKNEDIVYIPIEEDTTVLIYKYINKHSPGNLKYLLPEDKNFNIARNKKLLNEFCLANNIPAPKLYQFEEVLNNNAVFRPVICKPQIGSGAKGIIYINDINEIDKIRNIDKKSNLLQELLPDGKKVLGAFYLMKEGKVISCYGHERIRTLPSTGGVSVYSRFHRNEKLISQGAKLLKKLNWSGFAMVEFLWDPKSSNYKVIEVNPRLWGSILLSEKSNSNFIINYINLSLGKGIIDSNYRYDVYISWLILDFINILKEFRFIRLLKNSCFINITYGKFKNVLWFHFFLIFNKHNFNKLISKWRKK